ncbi:hypothetical protein RHMOL_Rhmol09G0217600 [Rhododendron molle]|uniref:Uncharacterized protein n=1 Tax=Rhododendron molle TaxID=49168 RepID=A0ACC0MGI2_RHOML|nr:hypothetical protein RHMOL_Rhmol09G0217600 [Rhododendron molle]
MDGEETEPVMVGGAVVWLWVLDGGGSEPVVVSSILVAAAVDGDAGGWRRWMVMLVENSGCPLGNRIPEINELVYQNTLL